MSFQIESYFGYQEWRMALAFLGLLVTYMGILALLVMIVALIMKIVGNCGRGESNEPGREPSTTETNRLLGKEAVGIGYGTCEEDVESGECSSSTSSSSSSEDLYDGKICVICYDRQRNCFFIPCGHSVACYICAQSSSKLQLQGWERIKTQFTDMPFPFGIRSPLLHLSNNNGVLTMANNDNDDWRIALAFLGRYLIFMAIFASAVVICALIVKFLGNCNGQRSTERAGQSATETNRLLAKEIVGISYGTCEEDEESGEHNSKSSSDDLCDGMMCVICYDPQRNCFTVPLLSSAPKA